MHTLNTLSRNEKRAAKKDGSLIRTWGRIESRWCVLFVFYFEDLHPAPPPKRSPHHESLTDGFLMCLNSDLKFYLGRATTARAAFQRRADATGKRINTQSAATLMQLAASNEARKLLSSSWWICCSLIGLVSVTAPGQLIGQWVERRPRGGGPHGSVFHQRWSKGVKYIYMFVFYLCVVLLLFCVFWSLTCSLWLFEVWVTVVNRKSHPSAPASSPTAATTWVTALLPHLWPLRAFLWAWTRVFRLLHQISDSILTEAV